ncbi:MAG: thiamine pyrophosphate-dependent enzyme [Steroidobacteraceae bacterium]
MDFCAIARGQGCQAIRVDRPEDLDDALRAAFTALQPILVEVLVE